MSTPPTGVVTFLFTDVESSTWLLQHLGNDYDAVLHSHYDLCRNAWAAHDGFEVSTEGDAFFVAFGRPEDAVRAAVAAQLALGSHAWPDGGEVRVRMGIHTGEARVYGNDYVGLAVHQAARVQSAAHGGQIIVSESTRAVVGDDAAGLAFIDLGQHRLKDLAQPVRLFQVAHEGLATEVPPPRTLTVMPNNLPLAATSFVGREIDIASVRDALLDSRVVTLTGAGGVGKTRLALQVGAESLDDFANGAWLVDLAPVADPALVPNTLADVLGVRDQPGRQMIDAIVGDLREKRLLIVLDNCEHLIDACADLVHRVTASCAYVKVLATSREALNVPGETALRLRSLDLPAADSDIDQAARTESVRLFVQRVRASRPDFELDRSNADAVVNICRRLDGLPLALELAAARVHALGLEEVARRLDDRFRLLAGGSRVALPRQRTLEATVSWSYELLSVEERELFDRLSVFSGGCTLDAAEMVCADGGIETSDVMDLVSHLVEKSLVTVEDAETGEVRYRMLETLRQFGRDRLVDGNGASAVRDRHLAWAVTYVERPRQEDRMALDTKEWENLRSALEWAFETGQVEPALRIVTYATFSHFDEQSGWFDRLLPNASEVPRDLYGQAVRIAAGFDFMRGRWEAGVERNREARAVFEETGDRVGVTWSRVYEGVCLVGMGEDEEGRRVLEDVLVASRALTDRGPYARTLLAVGWMETEGDLDRADELAALAGAVAEEIGALFDRSHARELCGYVRSLQGRMDEAGLLLAQSLRLYEEGRIINCGAHCLETAAAWMAMNGRNEAGAEIWGAADRIRERTGDVPRPWERNVHERWLPLIKQGLPPETFEASYALGLATGWREAVNFAEAELTKR